MAEVMTIIDWRRDESRWIGRGASGTQWCIERDFDAWSITADRGGHQARALNERALMDAATSIEAIVLSAQEDGLRHLPLGTLLVARTFAYAQMQDLISEMREAGFDPMGMTGPCEPWMAKELGTFQQAIDAFERSAVEQGWRPTLGG